MICSTPTMADLIRLYALHHPCLRPGTMEQRGYAVKSLER